MSISEKGVRSHLKKNLNHEGHEGHEEEEDENGKWRMEDGCGPSLSSIFHPPSSSLSFSCSSCPSWLNQFSITANPAASARNLCSRGCRASFRSRSAPGRRATACGRSAPLRRRSRRS